MNRSRYVRYVCPRCEYEFLTTATSQGDMTCPRCRNKAKAAVRKPNQQREHVSGLLATLLQYVSPHDLATDAETGRDTVEIQVMKLPAAYLTIARTVFLGPAGMAYLRSIGPADRDAILDDLLELCPDHALVAYSHYPWWSRQIDIALKHLT